MLVEHILYIVDKIIELKKSLENIKPQCPIVISEDRRASKRRTKTG